MIQLTTNQLQYFKDTFGFDASVVSIYNKPFQSGKLGEYDSREPGIIFVDEEQAAKVHPIFFNATLVHEITHLLQFEQEKTLSLDFTYNKAIEFNMCSMLMPWCERPLEIDAVISEVYYIWMYNKDNNIHHVSNYCRNRFKNNEPHNITVCLNNLKEKNLVSQEYYDWLISIIKELGIYNS